jgi:hypothetical protein
MKHTWNLRYQGERRQQAGDNYMFLTSNHMAATRGGGIGERRVFILHWSNLSAALQLVLVHAVDVLLGFHLVGGDGQSAAIISSFGR